MDEFVEKLIERLQVEEKKEAHDYNYNAATAFNTAIKIVNQLTEEYKHCALCYLGSPCEYQNAESDCEKCESYDNEKHHCPKFCKVITEAVAEIEENHPGWIPCSERLPEETECYFVTWRDRTTCKSYVEITEYDAGSQEWLDCICQAGLLGYDIIAWKPLPAPYVEK